MHSNITGNRSALIKGGIIVILYIVYRYRYCRQDVTGCIEGKKSRGKPWVNYLGDVDLMDGRTCTRRTKREFNRARTAEETIGKEANERHDAQNGHGT